MDLKAYQPLSPVGRSSHHAAALKEFSQKPLSKPFQSNNDKRIQGLRGSSNEAKPDERIVMIEDSNDS